MPSPEPEEQEAGEAPPEPQFATLWGFLSRPQVQKLNRSFIYIFVNRRLIRDRVVLHAIQQAYRNILPANCFPVALLFLDLPFSEVDVNVHPSKIEVRFRHQTFIHDLVRDTMRECLTASKPVSTFPAGASWAPETVERPESFPRETESVPDEPALSDGFGAPVVTEELRLVPPPVPPLEASQTKLPLRAPLLMGAEKLGMNPPSDSESTSQYSPLERVGSCSELGELRPMGQVNDSFIVASGLSGLWLIDQHAAHERVLFEKFLAQRDRGAVESQRLLLPHVLRLTVAQQTVWDQIANELEAAGFEAEPFGRGTIAVKAAPAGVKADDVDKLLSELVESLEREARSFSQDTVRNKIAASVACHAAIKINTPLEPRKMEWLLSELACTSFPMSCPHGRPVALKYEMREILKAFHRI